MNSSFIKNSPQNSLKRTVVFALLNCAMAILSLAGYADTIVNATTGIDDSQVFSYDGTPLPNGNIVWIGHIETVPSSQSDTSNLESIFEQWQHFGSTTIRSLPLPDSNSEGLFASSHQENLPEVIGKKVYWLILESEPNNPIFNGELDINIGAITGFGLYSSSHANWVFPNSELPIPLNTTTLVGSEINEAFFGTVSGLSNITLKKPSFTIPHPNKVPKNFETVEIPWPNQDELNEHILVFDNNGNSAENLISLGNPPNVPDRDDTSALTIDLSQSNHKDLNIFACVNSTAPLTINLAGVEIELVVPIEYLQMLDQNPDQQPIQLSFQGVPFPNISVINPEKWDPLLLQIQEQTGPVQTNQSNYVTIKARSYFDNIISSNLSSRSWAAIRLQASDEVQFPVTWTQIKLFTHKIQNQSYISNFSRIGSDIFLDINAEPGIPVNFQISDDFKSWDDLITLPNTSESFSIEFSIDSLSSFGYFRVWQELKTVEIEQGDSP